ncbi:NifB/NifX family molybdenum-iron cluster-binding protein [Desulfonatronovibrio hydrogenovorans]|uniref:NifB/NifX family molybdenum-iron cluster-binding protein n=1 Tax=Desulfonatronovibrio hydrogenovorans TaxID=53245 RepID=UPI00048B4652|nr:NifB/NifX family molybdenum-iron cluster-binding protein [Desulfonatronovibrio hydrogenovorans]
MNKIAITSEGPTLKDRVDPRFGRAAGFIIIDPETEKHEYVDNGSSQTMAHGAGIQAAQQIADKGAAVLLTGYVGPKAFQALQSAGVKIVQHLDNMSVQEALDRYLAGGLDYADEANK